MSPVKFWIIIFLYFSWHISAYIGRQQAGMDRSHTWGQQTWDRDKIWVFGMKKSLQNEVAQQMLSSDSQCLIEMQGRI